MKSEPENPIEALKMLLGAILRAQRVDSPELFAKKHRYLEQMHEIGIGVLDTCPNCGGAFHDTFDEFLLCGKTTGRESN